MNIPIPPGKEYQPHQVKCIRYAMGARGTIIADEMGLGKTIEAIGVINATTQGERNDINVVVICPAYLRLTWHDALDEWMVNSCRVSVISYNGADALVENYEQIEIDILIVDEAHYIKNPESQRTQNVARIAMKAKRVLLLTGTPMDNRPIELWPLLKIACPEKWNPNPRIGDQPSYMLTSERKQWANEGPSFWDFAERYCDLHYTYRQLPDGSRRRALDYSGASNLEELSKKLRATCMVRRLKKDVMPDLPEIQRQLIVIESEANDSDLFPSLSDETYHEVLKRLTVDKVLFRDWSKRRHEQALEKLDTCLRYIGDALDESEKIIVFAHHHDVVEKLYMGITAELPSNAYCRAMSGETPMHTRKEMVDNFQLDPKCRVIIGSIGAMGTGWNLNASDLVLFVELDPVPGRMAQAEARPHRIGQRNSVLVKHLVANGSLCARMARILVRKQKVLSAVLDTGNTDLVFRE